MEQKQDWSAFKIVEDLGDELDITFGATIYPWKVTMTKEDYDTLKNNPGVHWVYDEEKKDGKYVPEEYVYEKDGWEYVKLFDNHVIPFIIHARIAEVGTHRSIALDDLNWPTINEDYNKAFSEYFEGKES